MYCLDALQKIDSDMFMFPMKKKGGKFKKIIVNQITISKIYISVNNLSGKRW